MSNANDFIMENHALPPLNKFSFICKICGKSGKAIYQENKIKIKCECSNNLQTKKEFFLNANIVEETIKCINHGDKKAEKYLLENNSYVCNECFNNQNIESQNHEKNNNKEAKNEEKNASYDNINDKINSNENKNSNCTCNWILFSLLIIIIAVLSPFIIKFFNKIEKKMTIIGIDFGSTFSGYSILLNGQIDFYDDKLNEMISSEMIMDEYSKKALFIGNEAHNFPKNKIEPQEKLYFSQFKRNLEPKNQYDYKYYLKSIESNIPKNKTVKLENVIKEYLELLREHIQKERRMKDISIKNIKWIITVPPLWDEKGKKFMEEMAIKAGMINAEIALEPEAASLAIFHDKNIKKNIFLKEFLF